MTQRVAPFEAIAACHARLRDAASAEVAEWQPEVVPPTVGLGALGAALVSAEQEIDDDSLDRIASCVEDFLSLSGSNADAVATGFLEAIFNRAEDSTASVKRIVRHLGDRALAYIRAWDEFSSEVHPVSILLPGLDGTGRCSTPSSLPLRRLCPFVCSLSRRIDRAGTTSSRTSLVAYCRASRLRSLPSRFLGRSRSRLPTAALRSSRWCSVRALFEHRSPNGLAAYQKGYGAGHRRPPALRLLMTGGDHDLAEAVRSAAARGRQRGSPCQGARSANRRCFRRASRPAATNPPSPCVA